MASLRPHTTFILLLCFIQAATSSPLQKQTYRILRKKSHNQGSKYVQKRSSYVAYQNGEPPYQDGSPHDNETAPANQDFVSQFIDLQNIARAEVGVPPLVWDENVTKYARWWANQRRLYGNCQLQHSSGPYGENIFWGSGDAWTPSDASNAWVEEKQWYHYQSNSCDENKECGHYTQVVWKTSSRLGCARVTCEDADVFMTCNYDPPGNYIGKWPY